jgi:hypothetical protein
VTNLAQAQDRTHASRQPNTTFDTQTHVTSVRGIGS